MGESRTELIAWLNDLLGLGYTKVEQCGTGAAYAQIFDSIYGNVPMSKLNWAAKAEYEYLTNYKVLQEVFKRNKIAKPIPVERLIKCKMQDNLEWLQWSKKFWEANYPGGEYDAEGRRHGAAPVPPPLHGQATVGNTRLSNATRAPAARTSAARPSATTRTAAPRSGSSAGGRVRPAAAGAVGSRAAAQQHEQDAAAVAALSAEVEQMRESVGAMETERDFYFNKLREMEDIVTARLGVAETAALAAQEGREADLDGIVPPNDAEVEVLQRLQDIMYATEEGFVPGEAEAPVEEEEMF